MSHYSVALFALATGAYQGCVGRFGDGNSAREHAKRHTAALCGSSIESVIEGVAMVTGDRNGRPETCVAFAGPVSPSHHIDDLVAIVMPPALMFSQVRSMVARYRFDAQEKAA